jgi:glucan biosynthesis protein C
MDRHYGLDWLRIGAFGLLIFYHVGMVFVPWDFHVKTAHPASWVAIPMLATNSWRLMLLFVVSGYASRALLGKSERVGAFIGSRNKRLLIPLLFGIFFVIPLQPWVEVTTKYGYAQSLGWFWLHDYFRFGTLDGLVLPTWQHLWFVVYLWVYTMLLAAGLWLMRGRSLQGAFDRLFGTALVVLLPIGWLLFVDMYLLQGAQETHDLFSDPLAHLHYLPGFLFGFALAHSVPAMAAIARWWKQAALVAIASYVVVAAIEWRWPGSAMPNPPFGYIFAAARTFQGWCTIIALIGVAERYWNRDHPWRRTLTEAVFPFYIIHQTVIVGVEWALRPYRLPGAAEFAILVAATIAGCWAFYLIGREVGWLRPLIGLRGGTAARRTARPATLSPSEA